MVARQFDVSVRRRRASAVLDLHGQIDGFSEEALNSAYTEAEALATESIVLNFSDVDYINSTGIALIVGLLAQARKARRRLAVFGLSEHYEEIFKITRLSDFMDIYPDETSALSTLAEVSSSNGNV